MRWGKRIHPLGHGKRVILDGYKFPSKKEAARYQELKLLQRAGRIYDLQVHPFWNIEVNEEHICRVHLDFSYYENSDHCLVVEDVKAERIGKDGKLRTTDTRHSKIGRKLMLAVHGIIVGVVK